MYFVISNFHKWKCVLTVKAEGNGLDVEARAGLLMEPYSGKIIYEK
jgi:D-alanyl-D-alanine carboxypeptidase (penicillin-binding protein 5/6)